MEFNYHRRGKCDYFEDFRGFEASETEHAHSIPICTRDTALLLVQCSAYIVQEASDLTYLLKHCTLYKYSILPTVKKRQRK